MNNLIKKFLIIAFFLITSTTLAQSQVLYGAATEQFFGNNPSSLYMLDPSTGDATLIGPIGFDGVTGLEILPNGRLIGSANADAGGARIAVLIEINRTTGAGSLIGELGSTNNPGECGRMPDIAYDSSTGLLFGYANGFACNGITDGLFLINPNRANVIFIGPSGFFGGGNGLAVQPDTGTIFGTPFDADGLITINPNTGAGTVIPASIGNQIFQIDAMDFNPDTGVLFGSYRDRRNIFGNGIDVDYLVTVNTSDGTLTPVGQTIIGLDAIVFFDDRPFFSSVPTLSEYGLIITALLLLAGSVLVLRRRQKLSI